MSKYIRYTQERQKKSGSPLYPCSKSSSITIVRYSSKACAQAHTTDSNADCVGNSVHTEKNHSAPRSVRHANKSGEKAKSKRRRALTFTFPSANYLNCIGMSGIAVKQLLQHKLQFLRMARSGAVCAPDKHTKYWMKSLPPSKGVWVGSDCCHNCLNIFKERHHFMPQPTELRDAPFFYVHSSRYGCYAGSLNIALPTLAAANCS